MSNMSFREAAKAELGVFKDIMRRAGLPILKITMLVKSGDILEGLSDDLFHRHMLPEPFDFPSHIGNFREASVGAAGAYAMLGVTALIHPFVDASREKYHKRAKWVGIGAFAASSIVQYVGEKYGISNIVGGGVNTPDMLDAAYGIVWSGVTAVGCHNLASNLGDQYFDNREQFHTERKAAMEALTLIEDDQFLTG